jgi:hypothetical protein
MWCEAVDEGISMLVINIFAITCEKYLVEIHLLVM